MTPRLLIAAVVLCAAVPLTAASPFHHVEIRVIPPQPVPAMTIRSGESIRSVDVRNGKAAIPIDFPPPWTLGMVRFEADPYTAADVLRKRPWTIRELGVLRGQLEQRSGPKNERFTLLVARSNSEKIEEIALTVDQKGAFELRLPAATYHGAVLGLESGTRIRSGIVVKPGEPTDLGVLVAETAVPVSMRVLDSDGRRGLSDARVIWDPPGEMLNSTLSRRIYGRRWSAVTDGRGMAEIRPVGPLPHSARWRIEADGFASTRSAGVLLKAPGRFGMPDVRMRPEPVVIARIQFPRQGAEAMENAVLVAAENRDPRSNDFVPVSRAKLREGDTRFSFSSYGRKRVWVENAAQKKLLFHDFELTAPSIVVELDLRPVEISGRVTQNDKPVAGTRVSLADPLNGGDFLAQVVSDDEGRFRFTTWATGKMLLYTIDPGGGPGVRRGDASATLELTGRNEVSVDLEIPSSGFTLSVVDADTGEPVRAKLDVRSRFAKGGGRMGLSETDAKGRFDLSGFPEGNATVNVSARGYRGARVEVPISADSPDATVKLQRGRALVGKVVDVRGVGIREAEIVGGYQDEQDFQPLYSTTSDAEGRFRFESAPPRDVVFYVIAGGYALGTTTFASESEAVITLHPPSSTVVTLRQDNQPPEKVFLVMAAPAGQGFVPAGVLGDLAMANGMSLYQLCGSSVTGDVVLPEFLGPGTYDLFLARRGLTRFNYEKVGTIRTPLARNAILAVAKQ